MLLVYVRRRIVVIVQTNETKRENKNALYKKRQRLNAITYAYFRKGLYTLTRVIIAVILVVFNTKFSFQMGDDILELIINRFDYSRWPEERGRRKTSVSGQRKGSTDINGSRATISELD